MGEGERQNGHHVTRSDAIAFNYAIKNSWSPISESWPFAFGNEVCGLLAAGSGIFITYFFRRELNLRPYARLTCYLPVVGLSAMCTYVLQSQIITADILNFKKCPLCITTKACVGQLLTGVAYPLLGAPIVTFYLADRLLTYPVPPLVKAPKETYRLWSKLVQKRSKQFMMLAGLHAIVSSFVTFQKQESFMKMGIRRNKI